MRVINSGANNGFYNMAVDEALFQGAKEQTSIFPTLRFYAFSPPAITIGRFQKFECVKGISRQKSGSAFNGDIVRRPTGGRAVFHNGDLTYSLIISKNDSKLGGTVSETYKKVSSIFSLGLSFIGVKAEVVKLQSNSSYHKFNSCFSSIARYELQVNGKKILGSAQRIENGIVLQQGSLILNTNPEFQQIGLNEITGRTFNYTEIRDAIKEGFIKSGITIKDAFLTVEEQSIAATLKKSKYLKTKINIILGKRDKQP